MPLDAFRLQLDVNVTGQLAVTQAMLPALRRARGRIVMVSTIGVRFSPPFAGPLDAAKAALTALGETLRQELAPWGVRVVLVEPATINSGAADKVTRDAAAAMAAAEPRARALYADTFTAMLQVMERREANGSPPDVAAATIARALTARRPRAVYLCGKDSRRLAIVSGLPVPVLDLARRRVSGCPRRVPSPPDHGGAGQQPGRWPARRRAQPCSAGPAAVLSGARNLATGSPGPRWPGWSGRAAPAPAAGWWPGRSARWRAG